MKMALDFSGGGGSSSSRSKTGSFSTRFWAGNRPSSHLVRNESLLQKNIEVYVHLVKIGCCKGCQTIARRRAASAPGSGRPEY